MQQRVEENGVCLDLTAEQAETLVRQDVIYLCNDNECSHGVEKVYHVNPEFVGRYQRGSGQQYRFDEEAMWQDIERRLAA